MKKTIASIAFICYFTVTCGILVNFHYCMDRLASFQFFVTENKNCPKCGMHINKSHGCCRDEVKIIKMEVDQKAASNIVFELAALDPVDPAFSSFIIAPFYNAGQTEYYRNHSPPLLTEQDTYLRNRVFRI